MKAFVQDTRDNVISRLLDDNIIRSEFANFILGEYLGSGISRHVFENRLNKKTVIKINYSEDPQNAVEWNTWCRVSHHDKLYKWFAPIKNVSHNCIIIEQARAKPLPPDKKHIWVPSFFNDVSRSNWGIINNQLICIDYAQTHITTHGMRGKLVKVKL